MRRHPWAAAAGAYLVLALAVLARMWTLSASPTADAYDYFYPAFAYFADAVRSGRWPLWDPFTNCGLPFHADPQAPTLNPVALALGLAVPRPALAFVLFWVAHWILGGLGMLVLMRALRATPPGALVAALVYAFCGFFVGHAQHTSWIVAAAWLPLAIGLAHLAVAKGRMGLALLAGAALSLSALGGYPVLVGVGLYVLALWLALAFLGPWARFEGPAPSRARRVARVALVVGIVAGVLLLVWSPVLNAFAREAGDYTDRALPVTGEVPVLLHPLTVRSAFHPFSFQAALSFFFPYATVLGQGWMPADRSVNDVYLGLLALPLAATAFATRRPGRRPWWLLGLAALMLAVSMGERGRAFALLQAVVPPMRFMRHSGGYRLFALLPLAAAAGLGFSLAAASARARLRLRRAHAVAALAAVAAAIVLGVILRRTGTHVDGPSLARLFLPPLVVLPAGAMLFRRWGGRGRSPRVAGAVVLLVALDLAAHVHLTSSGVVQRRSWLARAEALPAGADPAGAREPGDPTASLNAQQLTHVPVARGYVTLQKAGFNDVLARGPFLAVLTGERYWLSPHATPARPSSLADLASRGAGDPVPVFVDGPAPALPGDPVVPGTFGKVRIASYAPERVELAVEVPAPGPAVLASTERFAPGWRVAIDGVPAAPLRTDLFFRGVRVPEGRHAVTWTYEPRGWTPLVALAALALLASVVGGAALSLRGS